MQTRPGSAFRLPRLGRGPEGKLHRQHSILLWRGDAVRRAGKRGLKYAIKRVQQTVFTSRLSGIDVLGAQVLGLALCFSGSSSAHFRRSCAPTHSIITIRRWMQFHRENARYAMRRARWAIHPLVTPPVILSRADPIRAPTDCSSGTRTVGFAGTAPFQHAETTYERQ